MSGTSAPKILIADDDLELRTIIAEILTANGAEVTAVADGQAAVQEAIKSPYDLCILDVQMPVMSGLEACPIICERAFSHGLPVLFLTGCSDAATIQQAFDAGASDFLPKPIQATLLWRRASNLILLNSLSKQRDNMRDLVNIVAEVDGEQPADRTLNERSSCDDKKTS